MSIVEDITDKTNPPGSIAYWVREEGGAPAGLHFTCPCGCKKVGGIDFSKWDWDGNHECPTANPSIDFNKGHWHGYLRKGEFKPV